LSQEIVLESKDSIQKTTITVDKIILCANSAYWLAALDDNQVDSQRQQDIKIAIDVNHSYDVVLLLIRQFYNIDVFSDSNIVQNDIAFDLLGLTHQCLCCQRIVRDIEDVIADISTDLTLPSDEKRFNTVFYKNMTFTNHNLIRTLSNHCFIYKFFPDNLTIFSKMRSVIFDDPGVFDRILRVY
jgi:hypothetical protein